MLKAIEIDHPEFAVYKYRRLIEGEIIRYGREYPSTVNLFNQAIRLLIPKSQTLQYSNVLNITKTSDIAVSPQIPVD